VPGPDAEGKKLFLEKSIRNWTPILPDPSNAPFGARLRYLRKRNGLTIFDLARLTGVSHNPISRIERGVGEADPAILGRLIAYFGEDACDVLGGDVDPYEKAIPVSNFGSWLRNFRMRRSLKQNELAKTLGVSKVTIWSYERLGSKPKPNILKKLRRRFKLNDKFEKYL